MDMHEKLGWSLGDLWVKINCCHNLMKFSPFIKGAASQQMAINNVR